MGKMSKGDAKNPKVTKRRLKNTGGNFLKKGDYHRYVTDYLSTTKRLTTGT